MRDTDLDLDLEFAVGEDEQAPGEAPVDGKYAGVAWGLAGTGTSTSAGAGTGSGPSTGTGSDVGAARSR